MNRVGRVIKSHTRKLRGHVRAWIGPGSVRFRWYYDGKQIGGGVRGKVRSFSRQARKRMMLLFADMIEKPAFWITLTIPDEQIDCAGPEAMVAATNRMMEKFRKRIGRRWPWMGLVWRREWEIRKSGRWKGELVPHLHVFVYMRSDIKANLFYAYSRALRAQWVRCMPYQDEDRLRKGIKVAMHDKSWAPIHDAEHAMKYASKYMAKKLELSLPEGVSLGRMWGYWGRKPKMGEGLLVRVPNGRLEAVGKALAEKVGEGNDESWLEKVRGCATYVLIPRSKALECFEAVFL